MGSYWSTADDVPTSMSIKKPSVESPATSNKASGGPETPETSQKAKTSEETRPPKQQRVPKIIIPDRHNKYSLLGVLNDHPEYHSE